MISLEMVLIGGMIAAIVLLIVFLLLVQIRNSYRLDRLTNPVFEYIEQKAKQRAEAIVAKAEEKAAAIVADTKNVRQALLKEHEEEVHAYVSTLKEEIAAHSQELRGQLEEVVRAQVQAVEALGSTSLPKLESAHEALTMRVGKVEETFVALEETATGTTKQLAQAATEASVKLDHAVTETAATIASKLDSSATEAIAVFKEKLSSYDADVARALEEETSRLLAAVETSVAAYKDTQTTIIDQHIAQIVEDVAKQVLHRQLTITEHALVATEALEEAKEKGLL